MTIRIPAYLNYSLWPESCRCGLRWGSYDLNGVNSFSRTVCGTKQQSDGAQYCCPKPGPTYSFLQMREITDCSVSFCMFWNKILKTPQVHNHMKISANYPFHRLGSNKHNHAALWPPVLESPQITVVVLWANAGMGFSFI